MTKKGHFKDARLLEALDYIDRDLVGEVAVKLRFDDASSLTEEPVITWRTPFKHWKSLAALAACILLLSIASPLVGYIAQVITDWGAAAGSSNTSVLLTESEMTNGMYDEYILTEEDIADINEAYFKKVVLDDPNYADADEATLNELREKTILIDSSEEATQQLSNYYYLGKYGDTFVIIIQPNVQSAKCSIYTIGKYEFTIIAHGTMVVCYNSHFYSPEKAYEMGVFTEYDVEKMYQTYSDGYFDWLP